MFNNSSASTLYILGGDFILYSLCMMEWVLMKPSTITVMSDECQRKRLRNDFIADYEGKVLFNEIRVK